MANPSRYAWAVLKNHALLHEAQILRSTLNGMGSVHPKTKVFTLTVYNAVWFAYIASIAKAFEKNSQVVSIWYVRKFDEKSFDSFLKDKNIEINELNSICEKIKIIRDQSHFHIDRNLNINEVFSKASVPWNRVDFIIDALCDYLSHIRINELGVTALTDHGFNSTDAVLATISIEQSETRSLSSIRKH